MDATNSKPDSAIKESEVVFGDAISAFSLADWRSHLAFRAQMLAKIDVDSICGAYAVFDSSKEPPYQPEICSMPVHAISAPSLTNSAVLAV
jgi:hypothetical protein